MIDEESAWDATYNENEFRLFFFILRWWTRSWYEMLTVSYKKSRFLIFLGFFFQIISRQHELR
jgi:hypothetical protein